MLVLFDLDGTLTDPFEGISQSAAYALAVLGLPPLTRDQQRAFIGPPLQDSFGALGLAEGDVAVAIAAYRERYGQDGLFKSAVYDGIQEMLTALIERGSLLVVATSKPTVFAQRILQHFGLAPFFASVAGATLDGARRHKADIINFALTSLDVPPADGVMVGDRAQDVFGARTAGMPCIGVGWGYAEPGELEQAGARKVVQTPVELLAALTAP